MNIASCINRSVREYPKKIAVRMDDVELTYEQFHQKASSLAQYLLGSGVKRGDKIGVYMMHCPNYLVTLYATWMIAGIAVPINYRFRHNELEFVIDDSEIDILVLDTSDLDRLQIVFKKFPKLSFITQGKSALHKSLEEIYSNPVSSFSASPCLDADDALLMYTSGTTGNPKGVRQTHRTNSASVEMVIDAWQLTSNDQVLVCLPMFHVGGLQCSALPTLFTGGTITLLAGWNAQDWINLTRKYKPSWSGLVATMLVDVVNYAKKHSIKKESFNSFRMCFFGGSPTPSVISDYFEENISSPLYEIYGQTELSGLMITYLLGDKRRAGSMGQIMRQVAEGKIVSHDGKRMILPGENESGELYLKGDVVTPGYWKRQDLNEERFIESWLKTGDVVSWDKDGYLYYADRFDDMIITGGENVYPKEVENILAEHPGVAEVAVIGTPHDRWIEQVTAIIVPIEPNLTKREIIEYCESHPALADFKKPRRIEIVDELPKTGSGKLSKHTLKEQYRSKVHVAETN